MKIVNLLIIGVGGYLLYDYLKNKSTGQTIITDDGTVVENVTAVDDQTGEVHDQVLVTPQLSELTEVYTVDPGTGEITYSHTQPADDTTLNLIQSAPLVVPTVPRATGQIVISGYRKGKPLVNRETALF